VSPKYNARILHFENKTGFGFYNEAICFIKAYRFTLDITNAYKFNLI